MGAAQALSGRQAGRESRASSGAFNWTVFGIWMAVGLVVYFGYGARRSRLATEEAK